MAAYIARRLSFMVVVLLVLTFVTFMMAQIIPGDPAHVAAGRLATPAQVQQVRVRLGLDKPILVQYVNYVTRLSHGDLGTSVFTERPILLDLLDVVPSSVELVLAAMLINISIAVPLGVLAAYRRDGPADALSRLLVALGVCVPVFWLGLLLQLVFGAKLGWFPIIGQVGYGMDTGARITGMLVFDTAVQGRWEAFFSALHHLILPAITLSAAHIAVITRTVRSTMMSTLEQDYVTLARAKGLLEQRVLFKHALPNAILPSITILGMQVGWMLSFTVLVETIFGRTGIGSYAVTAVLQSDLLAVVAVVLLIGVVFVVGNFVVDLVSLYLNPRLRPA